VALAAFHYLSLLRSTELPPWLQQEVSALSHTRFRFAEKRRPDDYAVWVAEHLSWPVPRDLVLKAPQVVREWDAAGLGQKEILQTLKHLRVDQGRAVLMAKKDEHTAIKDVTEWLTEPWYGTEYTVERFDEEFLQQVRPLPIDVPFFLVLIGLRRMDRISFLSCTFLVPMTSFPII
jgi:insulysin